jgi:addiction module HigA family antidote
MTWWPNVGRLAKTLRVPRDRIESLVRGQRNISADTALRLGRYFRTSAEMWLNMQAHYGLAVARQRVDLETIDPA